MIFLHFFPSSFTAQKSLFSVSSLYFLLHPYFFIFCRIETFFLILFVFTFLFTFFFTFYGIETFFFFTYFLGIFSFMIFSSFVRLKLPFFIFFFSFSFFYGIITLFSASNNAHKCLFHPHLLCDFPYNRQSKPLDIKLRVHQASQVTSSQECHLMRLILTRLRLPRRRQPESSQYSVSCLISWRMCSGSRI